MYSEDDYLQLSGIQHFAFCRRQWALINIERQWADNQLTVAGNIIHERAHNNHVFEKRGNKITVHGLAIKSSTLGLSGMCDIVEFDQDNQGVQLYNYSDLWLPHPVEYKRGKPKNNNEDRVQLCAQAICLEEMLLCKIDAGDLYYAETKRREHVEFTSDLREQTQSLADEMHQIFNKGYTPKVKPKKHCQACSLKDICLPKLQKVQKVSSYMASIIEEVL